MVDFFAVAFPVMVLDVFHTASPSEKNSIAPPPAMRVDSFDAVSISEKLPALLPAMVCSECVADIVTIGQ